MFCSAAQRRPHPRDLRICAEFAGAVASRGADPDHYIRSIIVYDDDDFDLIDGSRLGIATVAVDAAPAGPHLALTPQSFSRLKTRMARRR
jgi:hypothetical protein